ncbi:MAG: peptidylprolyl isomerase [Candidatus Krumholzibacteriia bacterium]
MLDLAKERVPLLLSRTVLWLALVAAATAAWSQDATDDPCARGLASFQDDNYIAAEPFLKRCLEAGETLEALLPLTVIAVLQERTAEGLDYGARALALAPDNAKVRYWYGRALLVSGDATGAMAQWDEGLRLDTTHAGILEGLARLSLQQGNDARAYNLLLQMKMQGSSEPWLHRMLSTLARRRGLWDRAADHWQDLVAAEGENEENLVILGELNILAGRTEQAVEIFRHAVQVLPSGATWGGLGEAWLAQSEADSAVVALRRAVASDPANAHNRASTSPTRCRSPGTSPAPRNSSRSTEAQPDDPVGHFKYGVHSSCATNPSALAQVERAVSLDSRYIEALVVLAQMYENRGRLDETLTIARLQQLDPGAADELSAWRDRLEAERASTSKALAAGKIYLQHIIVPDRTTADQVSAALAAGEDFGVLATRFSAGPTAVRGGDLGWVSPAEMMPELQAALSKLQPGDVTPPVSAGGAVHLFKRLR